MLTLRCNDWTTLKQALSGGQAAAFEASKSEIHVWADDEPRAGERCQCGALRWGRGSRPAPGGPAASPKQS